MFFFYKFYYVFPLLLQFMCVAQKTLMLCNWRRNDCRVFDWQYIW